jgi:hypothetical protein
MKWVPIVGIFWCKPNLDEDVCVYQLVCMFTLWPILLLLILKICHMA